MKRELGRASLILLAMIVFANLLNYFFQVLMGHLLTLEEFGTMNALFSIYAIVSLPFGVATTTTAHYVATYRAGGELNKIILFLQRLFRYIILAACALMILGIILAPFLSRSIRIENTLLVVLLVVSLSLGMLVPMVSGAVQGTKQFFGLGMLNVGLSGVKLAVGAVLVLLGFHLYGVMSALIVSNLAMTIVGMILIKGYWGFNNKPQADPGELEIDWKAIASYALIAFVINLCIALLSNVDMVLVKRFFSGSQAGFYGTATLFGRLVLYIPSALVLAMFPIAAEAEVTGSGSRSVATRILLYVGGLSVFCAVGLNLFANLAVKLLMGVSFLPAVPYVRITALMAVPVGLMVTLANYCLAIKKLKTLTISLSVGCIACLSAIELYHATIVSVVGIITITACLLFAYNLIHLFRLKDRARVELSTESGPVK